MKKGNNTRKLFSVALVGVGVGAALVSNLQAATKFEAELAMGAEYVDNLSVVQLDQVSDEGDVATVIRAGLSADMKLGNKANFSLGYRFNVSDFQNLDVYDQTTQTLSAEFSYKLDDFTPGISHHYANARLDGEDFLNLNRTSIYAGKLFDNGFYLRPSLTQKIKTFTLNEDRDSSAYELGADGYWFFNNQRSFLSLGVFAEMEDAESVAFDNRALLLRTRVSTKFEGFGLPQQLQLSWRYTQRVYEPGSLDFTDQRVGDERRDQRHNIEAQWRVDLNPRWQLQSSVAKGLFQSNLDSADYDETRYSLMVNARF